MQSDDILLLVENEVRWRLGREQCETCKRGAEADELASTALAQMLTQLTRIELARDKAKVVEKQETFLNPLQLVETIAKLPADNPTRISMLVQLEAQVFELQERLKELRSDAS